MGTISDKLTYLNTTKSQLKDMINYGLDDDNKITSSTTFRNYVGSIFKAFLESLNNPSILFNNLPKITGTGSNITLNDTANAPMRIMLNATDITQDGTPTPSSPQDIHTISGDNTLVVSGKNLINASVVSVTSGGLTWTGSNDGSISVSGTASSSTSRSSQIPISLETGKYCFSIKEAVTTLFKVRIHKVSGTYYYLNISAGTTSATITISEEVDYIQFYMDTLTTGTEINFTIYPQLEAGETPSSYEPYVSQTAEVNLKSTNLFDKDNFTSKANYIKNDNGTETSSTGFSYITSYIPVKPSTQYTLSGNLVDSNSTARVYYYDSSKTWISRSSGFGNGVNICTFTTPNNCYYIQFQYITSTFNKDSIMINEGSTALPYEEYYDYGEYCKMPNTDYKDQFIRTSGKQLLDKDNTSQGRLYENGALAVMSDYFTSQFIKVEPNTQYTKNSPTADAFHRFAFYSSNTEASFISQSTDNTITTPSNCQYLRFCGIDTEINTTMLNKGTTALPYEPYGTGEWYKENRIPKVLFNDLTWTYDSTNKLFQAPMPSDALLTRGIDFKCGACVNGGNKPTSNLAVGEGEIVNNGQFYIKDTTHTTTTDFINDLGNEPLYYISATPTYTKITGTLAEQLEYVYQLLKSYKGVTNISQVNNDLPFVLDVQALEDLEG